ELADFSERRGKLAFEFFSSRCRECGTQPDASFERVLFQKLRDEQKRGAKSFSPVPKTMALINGQKVRFPRGCFFGGRRMSESFRTDDPNSGLGLRGRFGLGTGRKRDGNAQIFQPSLLLSCERDERRDQKCSVPTRKCLINQALSRSCRRNANDMAGFL